MGEIQTEIKLLEGRQIERVHIVESERTRQADHYLIIECADGTRVLTPYVTDCPSPAPPWRMALKEAVKRDESGEGAFTVQEAQQLAEGKPLGPKGNTTVDKLPEDVTTDDARGLTQAEETITLIISGVSSAVDREALEAAKDEATEQITNLPQDRRGRWYDKLGKAYRASRERIKREEKR
jgi:hypothetical protein